MSSSTLNKSDEIRRSDDRHASYLRRVVDWEFLLNLPAVRSGRLLSPGTTIKVMQTLVIRALLDADGVRGILPRTEGKEEPHALALESQVENLLNRPEALNAILLEVRNQLDGWLPFFDRRDSPIDSWAKHQHGDEEVLTKLNSLTHPEETVPASYPAYLRAVANSFSADYLGTLPRLHRFLRGLVRWDSVRPFLRDEVRALDWLLPGSWSRGMRRLFGPAISRIRQSRSGRKREPKIRKPRRRTHSIWKWKIAALRYAGIGHPDHEAKRHKVLARYLYQCSEEFRRVQAYSYEHDALVTAAKWGYLPAHGLEQIGTSALLAGLYSNAETAFRILILQGKGRPHIWRSLGHSLLSQGKEKPALVCLRHAIRQQPSAGMAHQNLASRANASAYSLQPLDYADIPEAFLFDAYNLTGERHVHLGNGDKGVKFFGSAIRCQQSLAERFPLPAEIRYRLEQEHGIARDEAIRILPYEWVSQIGHIAMLDTYRKLQLLGMTPNTRAVLLAPDEIVANHAYLSLWQQHFTIISRPETIQMLFPYQRAFGDCFNGYLTPAGESRCWTELGAAGHVAWDRQGAPPLISLPDDFTERGFQWLKEMGMSENDWFVALHVRGEGYHRERQGSMQSHRNSAIEDYEEAIRLILDQGGWVIRMGDPSMPKIKPMKRVIDYAHSPLRFQWLDIFLAAKARFFIGTTSGLTNAVMSLGTKCLLVNCISNYYQLWDQNVRFTLKPLWSERENRLLNLSEILEDRLRWKIFNLATLADLGITPRPNRPREITAATREMLANPRSNTPTASEAAILQCCERAGNPGYFGNGRLNDSFYQLNSSWIR